LKKGRQYNGLKKRDKTLKKGRQYNGLKKRDKTFEDTKGLIRIHYLKKSRQYNGQKDKQWLTNTTQKTKY
jgi:hypothetical protein